MTGGLQANLPCAILIDDDSLVRMTWEYAAQQAGKPFAAYASPAAFETVVASLPFDLPLFIDSNLGDGVKGEEFAKTLSERGFTKIFLVTGYNADRFAGMPWLAGVLDKMPPPWAFTGKARA